MKTKEKIITIIMLIVMGAMIYQIANFFSLDNEYRTARNTYEELEEEVAVENIDYNDKEISSPIDIDFDSLKAINEDVVAWLYIEAINISYPVMYKYWDNDYYLSRGIDGQYLISGSIFMEGMNNPDFTDPNTIIYGHNMSDESMFGALDTLYTNNLVYEDNTFWIITEDEAYVYQIFSMNYTTSKSSVYTVFSEGGEDVVEYIENRISDSLLDLDVPEYNEESKIVTLSTCGPLSGTQRFVVQGLLIGTV